MKKNLNKKGSMTMTHIVLLTICLASMNLINAYYYCIFAAIGIFCVIPRAKIHIDPLPTAMLLILAVSWMLFALTATTSMLAPIKPFTYVLCYILGSSMISRDSQISAEKTSCKLFYSLVFAIALGSLIHYLLNWIINIGASDRNTIDFWTRTPFSATGQAALACIPLALAIACLFSRTDKRIKVASAIAIVIVMIYNLILAGRTLIVMTLIIVAIAFSRRFLKLKKGKTRTLLITFTIIAALILAYQINLFGVRSFIENSPIYERFFGKASTENLGEGGRMQRKAAHIKHMLEHLWGGAHLREEYGYAHDIFLDTYDEAGIFAFIAVVVYMLNTLSHLIKCIRDKSLSFEFRQIVLCIYVGIYMEFMIEPILQGMPWLFALFCLIDGYVARLIRHNKKVERGLVYESGRY